MERARLRILAIVAGLFAFVFWLPSLALTDLVLGLLPAGSDAQSSHALGNVAYGLIGAVFVAPAFASQVRRPESKIAPLQQLAAVAIALACAALASGAHVGVVGAAIVLVPLSIVLALHPARREALRLLRPRRRSRVLAVLALAAVVPALVYAWKMASNGRADLPPEDSYAYVPTVWSAATALAIATVLLAFTASLRSRGWQIPAACVAIAAFLFGTASIVNPEVPASGGRAWGAAAIAWSIAWAAAAIRERTRSGDDV